jgi:hypothetical protein
VSNTEILAKISSALYRFEHEHRDDLTMNENERGMYGSSEHKIGKAGAVGLSIAFGLMLVGLGGSLFEDARERKRITEATARRARIAARAYVAKR